jgi:hypothetical protein
MRMKKFITYLLVILWGIFGTQSLAQKNDSIPCIDDTLKSCSPNINIEDNCKSIIAIKKEFIKKNLQLSETEEKEFWPIYNEYLKQESIIYDKYRYELEKGQIKTTNGRLNPNTSSDEQILAYLDLYYQTREATTLLEQKLYLDLKKVLKPKNLLFFLELEKSFKSSVKKNAQNACPRNK